MNEYDFLRLKRMKKISSAQGWTLLTYHGIMTAAVTLVALIGMFVYVYAAEMSGNYIDEDAMLSKVLNDGLGYFLAIYVGAVVLLLWKKPKYFVNTICKNGAPMGFGSFVMLFVIFTGVQGIFQLAAIGLEMLLNSMGLSILNGIDVATGETESMSMSMFLYLAIGAPISEEILFRGLVLRSLEPMGKKFAIFTSAMLFGLFHGNIIQIPFAFLVGLVLAYVTLEHSIWWAMLLHVFNNMILGDTLSRVLPYEAAQIVMFVLFYGCLAAGIIILLVKHKAIRNYLRTHRNDPLAYKACFSNAGVITFLSYMLINMVYSTYMLITPYTVVS